MDLLIISDLKVAAQIGVHTWEQRIKQTLSIDLHIERDFRDCQDDITHTLDYDAVCKTVTQGVESKSFQLIETVANEVALLLQQEFNLTKLSVTVSKPHAIKNAGNIQVVVNR